MQTIFKAGCSLIALALVAPALAADGPAGQAKPAVVAPSVRDPFDATPLATEQLARLRAGADTVSNDMSLSGTVANNTAINVASGMNIISNGSFSNASGLPVAIQNSGANVLIQNATIINVQLQ
ncbi:MAG: hypothetical protein ACEQSK_20495 [Sphingomonadaceae bacterium]